MGFKFWHEALIFVLIYSVLVLVPCYFIAAFGSKMINELGNFPTKSDAIQAKSLWKVLLVFVAAVMTLAIFFHIFY